MLTLYQTEWCPFSSAVREVLTELGIDFVARQVEPWPEQRSVLRERSGSDLTPVLETEDGRFLHGTRAIFGYLQERDPWEHADGMIGEAAYRRRNGRMVLIHTEVDEALEGRGLGSRLVATALEDARREGLEVVPLCPFVASFIDRHPEYQDVLAADYRNH